MATCDEHIIKKTISGIFMLVKTVGNSLFFLFMPFVFSVLSFCYKNHIMVQYQKYRVKALHHNTRYSAHQICTKTFPISRIDQMTIFNIKSITLSHDSIDNYPQPCCTP